MIISFREGIDRLVERLAASQLVVFVGSGISRDSGLPDWNGFVTEFINMARALPLTEEEEAELKPILDDAENHVIRDPVRTVTVIKNQLSQIAMKENPLLKREYEDWMVGMFARRKPNRKHELIVSTDYPYILTSNYDLLLEKAAHACGFHALMKSSLTFRDANRFAVSLVNRRPAIIHVHGIYHKVDSSEIVFSAEDYRNIIKNRYEGFSFALRTLFLYHSCLFVGYGASDPHLEDVAQDLAAYYSEETESPLQPSYLVVTKNKADRILERHKNKVNTHLIVIDDYSEYETLLEALRAAKPRQKNSSPAQENSHPTLNLNI